MTQHPFLRELDRLSAKLANRMSAIVQRGVVVSIGDGSKMQTATVALQDDDQADGVEHFQPGGISHRAGAGAEGVYLAVGAENANGIVISVSRRGVRVKASMAGGTVVYAEVGSNADVELRPDGTGGVKVGLNPEQRMVLGDALKTWLSAMTVPTAMGPSGTPINAAAIDTFLSTLHKLDA